MKDFMDKLSLRMDQFRKRPKNKRIDQPVNTLVINPGDDAYPRKRGVIIGGEQVPIVVRGNVWYRGKRDDREYRCEELQYPVAVVRKGEWTGTIIAPYCEEYGKIGGDKWGDQLNREDVLVCLKDGGHRSGKDIGEAYLSHARGEGSQPPLEEGLN